ncbi:hypothetical protein Dimus_038672 [Dionaea muscipula]
MEEIQLVPSSEKDQQETSDYQFILNVDPRVITTEKKATSCWRSSKKKIASGTVILQTRVPIHVPSHRSLGKIDLISLIVEASSKILVYRICHRN